MKLCSASLICLCLCKAAEWPESAACLGFLRFSSGNYHTGPHAVTEPTYALSFSESGLGLPVSLSAAASRSLFAVASGHTTSPPPVHEYVLPYPKLLLAMVTEAEEILR
uniref:Secreted protein n=1 Tax=Opuntia streptacantha TaxID=393608 RepID=A0A7C8YKD5_OPUST